MKYPQLVSTRAVNAISDWLVSRLEQLGVEAPQIYTRLLLSLLQSTIQLNDPIEFSNLESFFASRKGGNRRYLTCDTDTLKKFNAVQCLKDIVSSEQEIATIENLVDELCEKLKDIEKQTGDSEDEDKLLVATLSLAQYQHQQHHHHGHSHSHKSHHHHGHHNSNTKEAQAHSKLCSTNSGSGGEESKTVATSNARKDLKDSELDPRDRYYRAFPALSKEMEDSFVTWRRNAKWLTWPVEQNNQETSISTSSSSSTISSNTGGGSGNGENGRSNGATACAIFKHNAGNNKMDSSLDKQSKASRHELTEGAIDGNDNDASIHAINIASANTAGGGIKRNSKRRRSRALSKGKTSQQNIRKIPDASVVSGSTLAKNNNGVVAVSTASSTTGRNKRNASPTYWDTDFEGCWEMGRDLIKEFISRQNRNSRNRSTSESAVAYNKKKMTEGNSAVETIKDEGLEDNDHNIKENIVPSNKRQQLKDASTNQSAYNDNREDVKNATPVLSLVDFSFCDYDSHDDTLASVSELTNDGSMSALPTNTDPASIAPAKRLYERDLCSTTAKSDEQVDFAQFEAKFNSNIEALWKDAGSDVEKALKTFGGNKMNVFGFGSGSSALFSGPTSLPFDMPFTQNLKNFWANYYNHHFDLSKILPTSAIKGKTAEIDTVQTVSNDCEAALKDYGGVLIGPTKRLENVPNAPTDTGMAARMSDYYSMPSNLNDISEAKVQHCSLPHNSGCSNSSCGGGVIGEERKTPLALFLQNSIWSECANVNGGDTDESFYYKVHNSRKQLNQYGNGGSSNRGIEKMQTEVVSSDVSNVSSSNFAFAAPYTTSKWSEGINAGPPSTNMPMPPRKQQQKRNSSQKNDSNLSLNPLSSTECTDSSSSAPLSAASGTPGTLNWQFSKDGTSESPKAWATVVPVSATQMRDSNSIERTKHLTAVNSGSDLECNPSTMVAAPKVSLANHSTTSSGFIEYSRIKSVSQLQLPMKDNATNCVTTVVKQQMKNYSTRANRKEQQQRYALDIIDDGENLLTAERTHFHPIKSYVDGHTFDISSELDIIEYQRSASGYLYMEQDKYLEYTRTDNFMVEDDGGIGASTNPLYANSNCEAASANNNNSNAKLKRVARDFTIKFRVQRTEIACQTDLEPSKARAVVPTYKSADGTSTTIAQPHPLCLIFSNAAKNLKTSAGTEPSYNDTVEAFTRAIVHFPPPPPGHNSAWLPLATDLSGRQLASRNWNIYQHQLKVNKVVKDKKNSKIPKNSDDDGDDNEDSATCGELDFYGSGGDVVDTSQTLASLDVDVDMASLEQEWSMNEIRKKCKQAGHMPSYAKHNENNNTAGSSEIADGTLESVWGMCIACNSELKSIPANRMLRDELQLEADEIMSDLKYMQDLYIGRAGEEDDTDDEADDCVDNDSGADTVTSDSDWCAEDATEDEYSVKPVTNTATNINQQLQSLPATLTPANMTVANSANNGADTFAVIQKVNRLIAELLRPENNIASMNVNRLNANPGGDNSRTANMVSETTQFSGNLWHTDRNERNIWQLNAEDSNTGLNASSSAGGGAVDGGGGGGGGLGGRHHIQFLRQFNVKPMPPNTYADKSQTQISWEHENLAKIWQTTSPPPSSPLLKQQNWQNRIAGIQVTNAIASEDCKSESYEEAGIAEKNLRNLCANTDECVNAATASVRTQTQEFVINSQCKSALPGTRLINSALKLKAATRKRRHSASQHYFHAQLNSSAVNAAIAHNTIQNNNNNDIANLNNYAIKPLSASNENDLSFQNLLNASLRFGAAAAVAAATSNEKKCSGYARSIGGKEITYGCDATTIPARNHTIITCKYHLTAIEPAAMQDDGIDDTDLFDGTDAITAGPLSCLIEKNSSILKHVTMVTRPLTR